MVATKHFTRRVAQRIGPDVDAAALAQHIVEAVQDGRSHEAMFVARVSRGGKRLFRFRVPQRGVFYALVDTNHMACITVLPPGFRSSKEGGGYVTLREDTL